ncbi:MAG: glycosyltransferase [Chlorobiaceae bacterium]
MKTNHLLSWRWWLGMPDSIVTEKPIKEYTITVLVPAYNEEESIKETILSIRAQSVPIEEIIVIDDHSRDRTGEIARSMGVTVVRTDVNQQTKAKAQQYVLDRGLVKTDLFVTIDADTLLDSRAIEKTLPCFNDPMAACACGYVIPAKIDSVWERGRFIEYIFSISLFKMAQNHIGSVVVSSGCFSVYRTGLILQTGGFNSRTMAEDMDLTWELSIKGYRAYCVRDAYCYPFDPPTGKIFIAQVDRWYRSFFQNLSFHWMELLKKDRKLAAFTLGYLIDGSLFILGTMWLLLYSLTHLVFTSLAYAVLLDASIVSFFTIIEGIRLKRLGQVLLSLPAYQITRSVNIYVFWRSMWREWVIKERLQVWVKGH